MKIRSVPFRSASLPRRRFLEIGSATVVAAAVGTVADRAAAQAKYPKHVATQMCGVCAVCPGKAGDATGGCAILVGKAVNAKGWCSAWSKKA